MKKVVVFGGSGFLGSYVVDELTARGYAAVVADIKRSPYLGSAQEFMPVDILDPQSVENVIDDNVELVYNFAGLADINDALNLPLKTMQLNILGNMHILEACVKKEICRFVYASSAYAFSNKGSFYGISKFSSEKIIEEYAKRYGLKYSIIRYGSLYGERADNHNGIYRLLKQALEKKRIKHKGDGEEVREYIHARDAARLSVDILDDEQYVDGHIVLTGIERLRQKDVLTMIREILNDEVEIEYTNEEYKGHYKVTPYSFQPNVAKKLVANPFIDFGQGLVDCIKHLHAEQEADS